MAKEHYVLKCTGFLCGKFMILNAFLAKHKRFKINEIQHSTVEIERKMKSRQQKIKAENNESDNNKISIPNILKKKTSSLTMKKIENTKIKNTRNNKITADNMELFKN